MTTTQDYVVAGMSGEPCAQAVTEEVLVLPGVREVSVRLDGGEMSVTSDGPLDFEVVRTAVADAGYVLGSR